MPPYRDGLHQDSPFSVLPRRPNAFPPPAARFIRPGCHAAVLSVWLVLLAGCASLPDTATVQTARGEHSAVRAGTGSPTVIFEAGAGEKLDTWEKVFPVIAQDTTVFAYSRRGYGVGLPVLTKRDGATIVAELRALLAAEGLRPPYLLVGHSLGGLYLQLFAKMYPQEVAGAVLVDPTSPDQMARMQQEHAGSYALMQTMLAVSSLSTVTAEMRAMDETSRQWHAAGPFPRCPMILLSARRPTGPMGEDFLLFIQRMQAQVVAAWPGAEQRLVDSNHFIQQERPDVVIAAIREVLARGRPSRGGPVPPP